MIRKIIYIFLLFLSLLCTGISTHAKGYLPHIFLLLNGKNVSIEDDSKTTFDEVRLDTVKLQ